MPHAKKLAEGRSGSILLVEDSKFFSSILQKRLSSQLNADVTLAETLGEAQALLEQGGSHFSLALLDLNLPDAPEGEVVDLVAAHDIPTVVFTGHFSPEMRDQILSRKVIDYVVKDNPTSVDYLMGLIQRLLDNRQVKALVVDDSKVARLYVADLLSQYQFQVLTAENGPKALEVLESNPDIRLVITDYTMPGMTGVELTKRIRQRFRLENMFIIGISTSGSGILSADFIKNGANDFIIKPFLREEFFCRVNQSMKLMEYIDSLRFEATHDYLTGLYNRRFLFDMGSQLFANAGRQQLALTVAMVDVDHFKQINDRWGHEVGDEVLQQVAQSLRSCVRTSDVVARLGGEEFCIVAINLDRSAQSEFFDRIRREVEGLSIQAGPDTVKTTISIGICGTPEKSFADMLQKADSALYDAKSAGRNRIA